MWFVDGHVEVHPEAPTHCEQHYDPVMTRCPFEEGEEHVAFALYEKHKDELERIARTRGREMTEFKRLYIDGGKTLRWDYAHG